MADNWFTQNAPKQQSASAGGNWFTQNAPPVDFTGGPDNIEGKFAMVGPNGPIQVAYSLVEDASKAGLKMAPADRARYVKGAAADPNLKNLSPAQGVKVVGRNSAGQL